MSKKIVIHVGAGKTGSTSIQKSLFASKKINDKNLFFPTLLETNSSQLFRFAFCDLSQTPSNIKARFGKGGTGECYLEYQNNIKESFKIQCQDHESVVVSSEFLFLSSKEEATAINCYLRSIGFTDVHIIMYLRHPAPYYLSVAQQALKNQSNMPHPSTFGYNMAGAIEAWKIIKPKSITVKEFNRASLVGGDVITDFSRVLSDLGYSIDLKPIPESNSTMTVESTVVLQEYHRVLETIDLDYEERKKFKLIARRFSNMTLPGTKPVLRKEVREHIEFRFYDVITTLRNQYNIFKPSRCDVTNRKVAQCSMVRNYTDITIGFDFNCYMMSLKNINSVEIPAQQKPYGQK